MDFVITIPVMIISFLLFSVMWMINSSVQSTQALSELRIVREEFKSCDSKLLETAEKDTYNTCSFSSERGELIVSGDTIYYKIIEDSICEAKDWTYTDEGKRIKERCTPSGSFGLDEIEWSSPNIMFQRTGGKNGKTIEIRKVSNIIIGSESGFLLSIRIL